MHSGSNQTIAIYIFLRPNQQKLPVTDAKSSGGWHVTPHPCLQHFVSAGHLVSCLQVSMQTVSNRDNVDTSFGQLPGLLASLARQAFTHCKEKAIVSI